MTELASCLASGKEISGIRNLAYRHDSQVIVNDPRPPIEDLDGLPLPDKDLFFREYQNLINDGYIITSSRGCFYRCSYCNWNLMEKMYGKYYRRRSPGDVIKELVWAKERYAIKRVQFMDSIFTYDQKWLEEFLPDYKEKVGIPFFCYIYPSPKNDKKLINMLEDAGCLTITMGVQTINPKIRNEIYLRTETSEHIRHCIALTKKTRIVLILGFILFPTQTEQEIIDTLKFCCENRPDFAVGNWLMYFPGAEIVNISKRLSILNDDDIDDIEEGRDKFPYFKKKYPIKEISKIANLFYFSNIVPYSLMKNIIKSKLYRFMPSSNLYLPSLIIICLLKRKFKEPFISILYYIKYYGSYIVRNYQKAL